MNLKYALPWHINISVHSVLCQCHKHTHTRILKPFEDSEPTGLKVDIGTTSPTSLKRKTEERTLYKIPLTVRLIPISFEIEVIYRLLKVFFLVVRDSGQARAKKTQTDHDQTDALARHFALSASHVITFTCHMTRVVT